MNFPSPLPPNQLEKDMHRSFALVALAASGLFASATVASVETITVCESGCNYTSINAAIDAASNGDIIQLSAETYTEGVVINTDGKAITLLGTTDKLGTPTSILDGVGQHQVLSCITNESSTTVLRNLYITRGSIKSGGGGLFVQNASPSVVNCHFVLNSSFVGGGLTTDGSSMSLDGCRFENNHSGVGAGAYFQNSSVTIHECTFSGNTAAIGGGGACCRRIGESDNPISHTFTDCTFIGNTAGDSEEMNTSSGAGLLVDSCSAGLIDCRFTGNLSYGSAPALSIGTSESEGETGSAVIYDCSFCANTSIPSNPVQLFGDYQALGAGNCIAASCDDCPSPVEGDLDGDGVVDAADFIHLRELIGVEALGCVAADINGDGEVNGADLSYILGYWGVCSAP